MASTVSETYEAALAKAALFVSDYWRRRCAESEAALAARDDGGRVVGPRGPRTRPLVPPPAPVPAVAVRLVPPPEELCHCGRPLRHRGVHRGTKIGPRGGLGRLAFKRLLGVLAGLAVALPAWGAGLTLSWVNPAGSDGTRIERAASGDGVFTPLVTLDVGVARYLDTPLAPGEAWCYRAQAWNVGGDSDWSNTACATVRTDAPTVTVTPSGALRIVVAAPPDGAVVAAGPVTIEGRVEGAIGRVINLSARLNQASQGLRWDAATRTFTRTVTIGRGVHTLGIAAWDQTGSAAATTVTWTVP